MRKKNVGLPDRKKKNSDFLSQILVALGCLLTYLVSLTILLR